MDREDQVSDAFHSYLPLPFHHTLPTRRRDPVFRVLGWSASYEAILANQPNHRPKDPLRQLSDFLATRADLYEPKPESAAAGDKTATATNASGQDGDDDDEDEDMEDE